VDEEEEGHGSLVLARNQKGWRSRIASVAGIRPTGICGAPPVAGIHSMGNGRAAQVDRNSLMGYCQAPPVAGNSGGGPQNCRAPPVTGDGGGVPGIENGDGDSGWSRGVSFSRERRWVGRVGATSFAGLTSSAGYEGLVWTARF
jgi:hypothetical protein